MKTSNERKWKNREIKIRKICKDEIGKKKKNKGRKKRK